MFDWLQQTFQENSVLWLVLSSITGGFIGASTKFLFDVLLPDRVRQTREAIAIKRKYTLPILLAAQALRDRCENIIENIRLIESEKWFSSKVRQNYYFNSTLFVVGKFFGWVQILRQTIVYLDFSTTKETRKFERFLGKIESTFSRPSLFVQSETGLPQRSHDKWVHKYILQSMGALMMLHDEQGYRIIDYAAFCKSYDDVEDDEFRNWFSSLEELFKNLKADDVRFKRIITVHIVVNAFIDYLDPKHLQTEKKPYYWQLLLEEEKKILQNIISNI